MTSCKEGMEVNYTEMICPTRILITGENSFVGSSFYSWLLKWPDKYCTSTLDMKNAEWEHTSFSGFDVVLHVAGIAHVSSDPKMKDLYYLVNRDLVIKTAQKAKVEGVKQFIFMSSIIVYGDKSFGNGDGMIFEDTSPSPANFYADSKLQAERLILDLQSHEFKVVILRPPMIYGKGSKGNFPSLVKVARRLPIFPEVNNQRSMLYIDNLCEFIRLMIKNKENGIFFPQNVEYVNTSYMVKVIAELNGNKIIMTKLFNPVLILLARRNALINKAFGNLTYDKKMSIYKESYCIVGFEDSILLTENSSSQHGNNSTKEGKK